MPRCTIAIELEDRRLRVLTARGRGRAARAVAWHETVIDPGTGQLAHALRKACAGAAPAHTTVLVAAGDRRIVAGSLALPVKPAKQELGNALAVEARRAGMFADNEELVIGWNRLPAANGYAVRFEVAPRKVVDEVLAEVRAAGFPRIFLTSIETVLATGLTGAATDTLAIVDIRQDRVRIVLARAGVALAVRKLKLPFAFGAETLDPTQMLLPLVSELNRSLELFATQGLPAAQRACLAGDLALVPDIAAELQGMLGQPVAVAEHPALALAEGTAAPQAGLVQSLLVFGHGSALPWLVEPESPSLTRVLGGATLRLAGVAALAAGVLLGLRGRAPEQIERRARLAAAARARAELEVREAELRRRLEPPPAVAERQQILAELDRGRASVSRVLAVLARDKPGEVSLRHLRLADDGRLEIEGVIRDAAPEQAIAILGRLGGCLRSVPGVREEGITLAETDSRLQGVPFRYRAGLLAREAR